MEAGRLGKTGMRFGGKRRVMQDAETAHARAETAGLRMGGMSFRVVYAGAVWRAWDAQKRKKADDVSASSALEYGNGRCRPDDIGRSGLQRGREVEPCAFKITGIRNVTRNRYVRTTPCAAALLMEGRYAVGVVGISGEKPELLRGTTGLAQNLEGVGGAYA